jgi:hypothetical protein
MIDFCSLDWKVQDVCCAMLRVDILIKDGTIGEGKYEDELLEKELDGIGREHCAPCGPGTHITDGI